MSMSAVSRIVAVLLLVCLASTGARAQDDIAAAAEAAAPLPTISDEPTTIDPGQFLPEPLRQRATVDFGDSSLREVAEWLREEQGLVVLLKNDALSDLGILPSEPLSDKLDVAPIYLLLDRLAVLDLDWYFDDDILYITTIDETSSRLTTRPYNIRELLDAGYTPDGILDVILTTVSPEGWSDSGGEGDASFLGDVVFIRQSDRVHRETSGLLKALLQNGRRTFVDDAIEHAKLRDALSADATVEFDNTPLAAAIEQIAKSTGIDIRLDAPALQELGVRQRQPVTLSIRDRKLATVLRALLVDLDLAYVIRGGTLWITSQGEADVEMKTAVFDVRDLCRDESESNALYGAIVAQTAEVWVDNGGEASLHFARPGTLVVRGTEATLDEVLDLLETYRTALRSSKPRKETQPVDMDEVITVYYRLDANVAGALAEQLAELVGDDEWNSGDETAGQVRLVASNPDVLAVQKRAEGQTDVLRPMSVLVVSHTRAVHETVRDVIRRVERGDAAQSQGGLGGGGGFGGGYFSVPRR